jgi:hypothetical protein
MQKEAVVANGRTEKRWRLVSDEGPYLDGHDIGPCPLAFLSAGMVASYMTEMLTLAQQREVVLRGLRLTLDNYYTMEGSALRGTMRGGALPPRLRVEFREGTHPAIVRRTAIDAVMASSISGLMRESVESLFSLHLNGDPQPVGRVKELERPVGRDPAGWMASIHPGCELSGEGLIARLRSADEFRPPPGNVGSSLAESQQRMIHLRATCTLREDGVKEIVQRLITPVGSEFRFLSDEAPEFGGSGVAPDAVTYISAGFAFCFMTQLGRYAKITKQTLSSYSVIQDTHFPIGGASGRGEYSGAAEPVETEVFLVTQAGEEFARTALDIGEQTCFLHAFCRTPLKPRVVVRPLSEH